MASWLPATWSQVNAILALMALTLAAMGIYSAIAPFLAMPATALVGAAAAAGLAMVNSLGNLGGFVAPYAVGLFNDATGDNRSGLVFLSACLGITAVATYPLRTQASGRTREAGYAGHGRRGSSSCRRLRHQELTIQATRG